MLSQLDIFDDKKEVTHYNFHAGIVSPNGDGTYTCVLVRLSKEGNYTYRNKVEKNFDSRPEAYKHKEDQLKII